MPLYNTATTAAALGVTPKWLDNLLSHNDITTYTGESQGVARRLSLATITLLSLAKDLIDGLQLSVPSALRIAERALAEPSGELRISPSVSISVQREALRAEVHGRLAHAVETSPTPRRGRPPKR
jgi:hypothetical protein